MNAGIKSSCRYGAKRMFPIDFRNGISFVFLLTDFIDFPRHLSIHFPIIDSVFQSYWAQAEITVHLLKRGE